jgi:hypothetical protein
VPAAGAACRALFREPKTEAQDTCPKLPVCRRSSSRTSPLGIRRIRPARAAGRDGKKPLVEELCPQLVAWEDSIRGKCCGTLAQRIGNPNLAFGPVMASTERGTSAQRHATKPKAIEADIADLPDLLRRQRFLLFGALSVHNPFNRVIASRADKEPLFVTTAIIRMWTASRQVSPLAAVRACWSIDCAKAWRPQSLI